MAKGLAYVGATQGGKLHPRELVMSAQKPLPFAEQLAAWVANHNARYQRGELNGRKQPG